MACGQEVPPVHWQETTAYKVKIRSLPFEAIVQAVLVLVFALGGTISGEHGVGLVQKSYLDIVFEKTQLQLMRGIKKAFDPNNILNAGKIFD